MNAKTHSSQLSFPAPLSIQYFFPVLMLKLQSRKCFFIWLVNCHISHQRRQSFRMSLGFLNRWKGIWFLTVLTSISSWALKQMKLWQFRLKLIAFIRKLKESNSVFSVGLSLNFVVAHERGLLFVSGLGLFHGLIESLICAVNAGSLFNSLQNESLVRSFEILYQIHCTCLMNW